MHKKCYETNYSLCRDISRRDIILHEKIVYHGIPILQYIQLCSTVNLLVKTV